MILETEENNEYYTKSLFNYEIGFIKTEGQFGVGCMIPI